MTCPRGARGCARSGHRLCAVLARPLPDSEGAAGPLLSRFEGRGLWEGGGESLPQPQGPWLALRCPPSREVCAGGLCLGVQRPVGVPQGTLDRGLGPRLAPAPSLPHAVWEPEGRAGLRPQSLDGREGPGESGRKGWEGSWLSGPKGPPVCLVPTAPEAAWSQRPPCQLTLGTGDCLGQGQEPTGMRLLPGGWATTGTGPGACWGLAACPLELPDPQVHGQWERAGPAIFLEGDPRWALRMRRGHSRTAGHCPCSA